MRIIKYVEFIFNTQKLVEGNIRTNQEILKELEKAVLMMEFNEKYLSKFIKDGNLNHIDLLSFYSGEEIKDKYKMLSADIEALHSPET